MHNDRKSPSPPTSPDSDEKPPLPDGRRYVNADDLFSSPVSSAAASSTSSASESSSAPTFFAPSKITSDEKNAMCAEMSGEQLFARIYHFHKKLCEIIASFNIEAETSQYPKESRRHVRYFVDACTILDNFIVKKLLLMHIDDYDQPTVQAKLARSYEGFVKEFEAKLEITRVRDGYLQAGLDQWGMYNPTEGLINYREPPKKGTFSALFSGVLNADKKRIESLLAVLHLPADESVLKKDDIRNEILHLKVGQLRHKHGETYVQEGIKFYEKIAKNYKSKIARGISKQEFDEGMMVTLNYLDAVSRGYVDDGLPNEMPLHEEFRPILADLLHQLVKAKFGLSLRVGVAQDDMFSRYRRS